MKWTGIDVRLTSSDPEGYLGLLERNGISVSLVRMVGPAQMRLRVRQRDLNRMEAVARCSDLLERDGPDSRLYGFYNNIKNRLVLELAALFLLIATLWLPSRVLFVAVEGNHRVSDLQILQGAEQCGIRFGANRRHLRSERMKNQLLNTMPELAWACVNTRGCVAILTVREKPLNNGGDDRPTEASVVADRDGVILSVTATAGEQLCVVGEAVKKGQTLIGGRRSVGPFSVGCRAEGEVYARTERKLTVITPGKYSKKMPVTNSDTKYSLIIGKKRINLSKGSGISPTGCDKIVTEYYLTLPGGFVLPLALSVERIESRSRYASAADVKQSRALMEQQADRLLNDAMISGSFDSKKILLAENQGDVHQLVVSYVCREMIGREQRLNTITEYGENYGKNR